MASVPKDVEAALEPLHSKTWALQVSIHCEGCKRKVKKVLNGNEGVYKLDVNTKQQKVVVTGIVDTDTLIKRLLKSGKHAELWPDKGKKFKRTNNTEKRSDSESSGEEGCSADENDKPASAVKLEPIQDSAIIVEGHSLVTDGRMVKEPNSPR